MGTRDRHGHLARMGRVRLWVDEEAAHPFTLAWNWMCWDSSDGTVGDQSSGSFSGHADEVAARLEQVMRDLSGHMLTELDPFDDEPPAKEHLRQMINEARGAGKGN